MLFEENNFVTYHCTTGAMISWRGGFLLVVKATRATDRPLYPCPTIRRHYSPCFSSSKDEPSFNLLPEPPDPSLVQGNAPSSTLDVDVTFGISLPKKIRHVCLFSVSVAKVRVYRVKYAHRKSAIFSEKFMVFHLVFHPECPDSALQEKFLGLSNPLISETRNLLTRVIEAATTYSSAEQLAHARCHYLANNNPLSLSEKVASLNLGDDTKLEPMLEVTGDYLADDFFSGEEETLMLSLSKNEHHLSSLECSRHVLDFGHRYDAESKELLPHELQPGLG